MNTLGGRYQALETEDRERKGKLHALSLSNFYSDVYVKLHLRDEEKWFLDELSHLFMR